MQVREGEQSHRGNLSGTRSPKRPVVRLELGRELERRVVDLRLDELVTVGELGLERSLRVGERGLRDLVLDAPRGARVPVEVEGGIGGLERRAPTSEPVTTSTAPLCAPPEIRRCPIPASFVRPPALTLHAPGQYSPGISPTRASTPSDRRAATTMSASSSKRSRVPATGRSAGVAQARASVPSREHGGPPAGEPHDGLETRLPGGRDGRLETRGRRGPAWRRRARAPAGGCGPSPAARRRRPGSGSPPRPRCRRRGGRGIPA